LQEQLSILENDERSAQRVHFDHAGDLHTHPCQSREGQTLHLEPTEQLQQAEQESITWQAQWQRWCNPGHWVRKICKLNDTPHSIALGTAIGVFVAFTPTVGFQMLIVLALAFATQSMFRFNRMAALVAVYLSNPFTMVPIYWFNYRIGTIFLTKSVSYQEFSKLFEFDSAQAWWTNFGSLFGSVGLPLLCGSFVVATFFSLATYPVMQRAIERMQRRREQKRKLREQNSILSSQATESNQRESVAT